MLKTDQRPIDRLLAYYSESHLHPLNEAIHCICVPAIVFALLGWIGQFVGHKIEGKKPSFFDDLRYLLIGPLFVLAVLYRRLGIVY